jgi:hypothetical protein
MPRRSGFILTLKSSDWEVEMKTFIVTFSETVERQVVIEAKDEEMAQYKVIDDRGSWGDVIVTRVVEKEPK